MYCNQPSIRKEPVTRMTCCNGKIQQNNFYLYRWQTCAEETNNLFGWAISHRLIQLSTNSMMAMQVTGFKNDEMKEMEYFKLLELMQVHNCMCVIFRIS